MNNVMDDKRVTCTVADGVMTILVDNQKRKNAWTGEMLKKMMALMEEARLNDAIKIVYWTAKGEMYSAGNDINNFVGMDMDEMIKLFEEMVEYLIKYPKVLIAGVNGMAVGMSFTILFMFDFVLCADSASFMSPFIQTYQTPEACSSFTFPLMLGRSMASHLLLAGGSMTPEEAKNLGFVTSVYERDSFEKEALEYVKGVAKFPLKNLMKIKSMMTKHFIDMLLKVNKEECKELRESWNDENFQKVLKKFVKDPKF